MATDLTDNPFALTWPEQLCDQVTASRKIVTACAANLGGSALADLDTKNVTATRLDDSAGATTSSSNPGVIEPAAFRAVMRHQINAVSIVASCFENRREGLTATSVCSLADDPPTILVCVNQDTAAHAMIKDSRCFSINFLTEDQQSMAEVFSGSTGPRGDARFHGNDWADGASGAPHLKTALAVLDCDLLDCHDFASHTVFIGAVRAASACDTAQPLLYFRSDYIGLG